MESVLSVKINEATIQLRCNGCGLAETYEVALNIDLYRWSEKVARVSREFMKRHKNCHLPRPEHWNKVVEAKKK